MAGEARHEWDSRLPASPEDVVALLRRRIEVHAWWRDFCLEGTDRAKSCEDHGTGTAESHQRYINQYEAAIKVIEAATA